MWDLAVAILVAGFCVGSFKAGYYMWDKQRWVARILIGIGIAFGILIITAMIETIIYVLTRR
jgi:hypothetical protein